MFFLCSDLLYAVYNDIMLTQKIYGAAKGGDRGTKKYFFFFFCKYYKHQQGADLIKSENSIKAHL